MPAPDAPWPEASPELWARTYTVVMAGGVGARFWPMSRRATPKQLQDLAGEGPMLQATLGRLTQHIPLERQLVVTGRVLGEAIRELEPGLPAFNVLEEPCGRNTAPAIGWAAHVALARDPDALLAVLPADHHVTDPGGFRRAVGRALVAADGGVDGRIVTLGITPTRPETGYGYIQQGAQLGSDLYEAASFREKPDLATAAEYLASGDYAWNAGMFFMPAKLALAELARHEPELSAQLQALAAPGAPGGVCDDATLDRVYPALTKISIDYAVMERSDRVAVVPGDFGWSDVGSWRTLWDFRADPADAEGSFTKGSVIELDGGGNVLMAAPGSGTVAVVGVRDLIVVHTADATLVVPRESAQRVREIVDALGAEGLDALL